MNQPSQSQPITPDNKALIDEAQKSHEVLMRAKTIFPFVFFPDEISIDRVKVTIIRREFFSTATSMSIQIEDILNIEADVGPFFGAVKMWTRFFSSEPLKIDYLSRKDAMNIKQILQGYIIAVHKEIDCTNMERRELIPLLKRLGRQA